MTGRGARDGGVVQEGSASGRRSSRDGAAGSPTSEGSLDRLDGILDALRINEMRKSMDVCHNNIAKLLLSSKETLDRRSQLESAFRFCKEAFLELSSAYLNLVASERTPERVTIEGVRDVIEGALADFRVSLSSRETASGAAPSGACEVTEERPTYANIVAAGGSGGAVRDWLWDIIRLLKCRSCLISS